MFISRIIRAGDRNVSDSVSWDHMWEIPAPPAVHVTKVTLDRGKKYIQCLKTGILDGQCSKLQLQAEFFYSLLAINTAKVGRE